MKFMDEMYFNYSKGLKYELVNGDYYTVVGIGECTDIDIIIPMFYRHKPVTIIGELAFSNCQKLRSITFSDNIEIIGSQACLNCQNLTRVTFGNHTTKICYAAFEYCNSLKRIEIPDSVTSIGDYAFDNCSNLSDVILQNHIAEIDYHAFEHTALYNESSNWNDGVLYIGRYLIKADCHIVSGDYIIRNDTICMACSAFKDCIYLTGISIPQGVKIIPADAFIGCTHLIRVDIPNSVIDIDCFAFYNCQLLSEIKIPTGVMNIGYSAFADCARLTTIRMPSTVSRIEALAFNHCSNLQEIIFFGNAKQWEKIQKDYDWHASTGSYMVYCFDKIITKGKQQLIDTVPLNSRTLLGDVVKTESGFVGEVVNAVKILPLLSVLLLTNYHQYLFVEIQDDKTPWEFYCPESEVDSMLQRYVKLAKVFNQY